MPSGIALFEHQRAVVDIFAPDVEVQHRERKPRSVLDHVVGKARRDALAARLTVQIGRRHTNRAHVGVLSQPVFHHFTSGRHGTARHLPRRPAGGDRIMPLVLSPVSIPIPPRSLCRLTGSPGEARNLIKFRILSDQLRTQANSAVLVLRQMPVQMPVHPPEDPDQQQASAR